MCLHPNGHPALIWLYTSNLSLHLLVLRVYLVDLIIFRRTIFIIYLSPPDWMVKFCSYFVLTRAILETVRLQYKYSYQKSKIRENYLILTNITKSRTAFACLFLKVDESQAHTDLSSVCNWSFLQDTDTAGIGFVILHFLSLLFNYLIEMASWIKMGPEYSYTLSNKLGKKTTVVNSDNKYAWFSPPTSL